MIRCDNCGFRNEDDATFCAECSAYLAWDTPDRSPAATPDRESNPAPPDHVEVPEVAAAASFVEQAVALAESQQRPDLAAQLKVTEARMSDRVVPVAIVGEFKRGKSSLVNALLQTEVCPVDADEVTAVPTFVRHGVTAQAVAYVEPESKDAEPLTETIALEDLADYVLESGNTGNRRNLRSVEVQLPHRLLRTGLCLVDTPGVGGLDSAHGAITLRALDLTRGLIFVTDASQELTAPELEFLHSAIERCPVAACVITKTDLYPEWRRIVELDRAHLRRAGLEMAVIPLSSFLRMRARADPALADEDGFTALATVLADVVNAGGASAAAAAAEQVEFVAEQIAQTVRVERAVVTEPERAESVVAEMTEQQVKAERLVSATATWQQMLTDGVQDLVADVEHDLQQRLRGVLRDLESVIDAGDPKETWSDTELWLQRQIVDAMVGNGDVLTERTQELAVEVASRFDLDSGEQIALPAGGYSELLDGVRLAGVESLSAPGSRLGQMLLSARMATFLPMMLFGVAAHAAAALTVVLAPASAVLAVGVGRKMIKDERARQVSYRRQQAKMAGRRYIDEAAFVINKQSRDSLRMTQRLLRDEFTARATAIHRSSQLALEAVARAASLDPGERQRRAEELAAHDAELGALRRGAASLALGAGAGARG